MKIDVNNLDKYLNSLFGKKEHKKIAPEDSFVTYLGNRLKFEFAQKYKREEKTSAFSPLLPIFSWRLAPVGILALVIIFAGTVYFSKSRNNNQLVAIDKSISNIESELAYLDQETQEIISYTESTIEQELIDIEKM